MTEPERKEEREPDRRSFFKDAVVAAAAVGGGVTASTAAGAEPVKQPAAAKAVQAFQVRFEPKKPPMLKDVQLVIESLVRRGGCPTCGLTGIDIRLHAGDPLKDLVDKPIRDAFGAGGIDITGTQVGPG